MEGTRLMGELFIQKPNGETTTIAIDGTVIKEQQPLQIDWCDKCEQWKPLSGGHMVANKGLALIWICQECK
jgi:hypothetical protein